MSVGIFLVVVLAGSILLFALMSGSPRTKRRRSHSGHGSNRTSVQTLTRDQIFTRWQTIQTMAQTGGGNGLRQAISEADKLFDQVLRQQGLSGDSMGDRLKSVKPRFAGDYSTYDGIWRAHKLRNALAHEVGFDLVPSQAREALTDFERGLKALGAL